MFKHNRQAYDFQIPVYIDAREFMIELKIKSVLDIGCGNPQKLKAYIHPFIDDIVGLDLQAVVDQIKEACGTWIGCDLNDGDIDLKRSFGLIIVADVIEHLKNPTGLFDVIKRHADDSTVIIISTPEKASIQVNTEINPHNTCHETEYTKDEMQTMINQNGLCVINIKSYTERHASPQYLNNMFLCEKE